jgi:hypothetical protein
MDQQQRLQMAQISSPSLRVAAAPSQSLNLSVGNAPQQPTLSASWLNTNPDQPAVSVNNDPGSNSNSGNMGNNQSNGQDLYTIKLPSTGKTMQQYLDDYNNADSNGQRDLVNQLSSDASMNLNMGDQNIKNKQIEAAAALHAINNAGVKNTDTSLNGYLGFLGDLGHQVVDHTLNFGQNLADSAGALMNGTPISQDINDALYHSGVISQDQYVKQTNDNQNRLSTFTGGMQDKGAGDRALRSLGAAAEGASYVLPGAEAAGGFAGTVGGLAADTAVNAGLGGLSGLANGTNTTAQDVISGGAGGAIGGAIGNLAGKAIHGITSLFTSGKDATAQAIADTSNPSVIQQVLGTSPEIATYLAAETNKDAIANTLKELGVGGSKDVARDIIAQSAKDSSGQQSTLPMLDPMHPTQAQLPGGYHPDGAPDPVLALESQVGHFSTPEDFSTYVQHLSGDDAAAAKSALNGMTPEEFYAKAGGGSQVQTNVPAEASATELPPEDQAAIQAAGGNPQITIPELSKLAQNSLENAPVGIKPGGLERAAGEIDNGSARPIQYRTTEDGKTVIEDGRHRLEAARQNGINDFPAEDVTAKYTSAPKDTTATDGTAIPAEDLAAMKAAGAELPHEAVAAEAKGEAPATDMPLLQEHIDTMKEAGVNTDTQAPVSDARQALIDGLQSMEHQSKADAQNLTALRAQRFAKATNATDGLAGTAATQARLKAMGGAYNHTGGYPGIEGDHASIIDQLSREVQADARLARNPATLTNVEDAIHQAVSGQGLKGRVGAPTPGQINLLRTYLGNDVADAAKEAVVNTTGKGERFANMAGQIAGIPKGIMATLDLSGSLRQGGSMATRFPKEWGQAMTQQFKYFAKEKNFEEGMAAIAARPNYQNMLDAKLAVTGTEALDGTEEQFVSHLMNKVPGIGGSERAYTGFLTDLRANVFDRINSDEAQALGRDLTPEEQASVAKYINTFTGRGDLGKFFEQHGTTLQAALFSPKLWKSRLDMLNPVYYAKLDPVARKYALQNAASFAATAGTVLGLASLAPGVTVDWDPRSSDFMKIKMGNERYDVLGGLQQNLVLLAREISGEKMNSETGKVTKFGYGLQDLANMNNAEAPAKGPLTPNRLSILFDMFQNKENPMLATLGHIISGQDRGGKPVNVAGDIANTLVPLSISGVVDTANDIGSPTNPGDLAKGFLMNLPDMFGVSAQNYGQIPTKYKGDPSAMPNAADQTYTGPVQPNMVTDYNGKVILDKNGQPMTVNIPPGADDLTRQAIIDNARPGAVRAQFERTLSTQDQALFKLNATQLRDYQLDGKITQDKYNQILDLQKKASTLAHDGAAVPDGAQSQQAQDFYRNWNSMTKGEQAAWLKAAPDQNASAIAQLVNSQRSNGLQEFKPSNALSKLYSEYENDIHAHPEYTDIDLRQKARSFQSKAAQLNYNENVQDLYNSGGSADVKTLIRDGKVGKQDLSDAIALDNQLYSSGLESSLKFSKTFRNAYSLGLPANYVGSSGGGGFGYGGSGSSVVRQRLQSIVPQVAKPAAAPDFSAGARLNPVSTVKFKAPQVTPTKGGTRVTAAPFRTIKLTTLRNSVAD